MIWADKDIKNTLEEIESCGTKPQTHVESTLPSPDSISLTLLTELCNRACSTDPSFPQDSRPSLESIIQEKELYKYPAQESSFYYIGSQFLLRLVLKYDLPESLNRKVMDTLGKVTQSNSEYCLVVLTGKSGCGKSFVINALRLLAERSTSTCRGVRCNNFLFVCVGGDRRTASW